jgi:hypothetical protein
MAEFIQSESNVERALHYAGQARKFRDLADAGTVAEIKAKLLMLAEQYNGPQIGR